MADCEAVAELRRCAGSQLDPGVVAALLAIGPAITSGEARSPVTSKSIVAEHPELISI